MNEMVSQLFFEALDLPPQQRKAFISATHMPQAMRDLALRLVAAHEAAGDFMERTVKQSFESISREGSRVGPYLVQEPLGEGGMGDVYLATHQGASQEKTALKFLRSTLLRKGHWQTLFAEEQKTLATLNHPYIVGFHHQGMTEDGCPYMAMEWVDGQSLLDYCASLSRVELLRLMLRICVALKACHGRNILHCDLKPENILVRSNGTPCLLDFGIACEIGSCSADHIPMTLPYASPEQVRREQLDVGTDIHALGVLLYQLILGEVPLADASTRARKNHLKHQALPCSAFDEHRLGTAVTRMFKKATAFQPKDRYHSVDQMIADLHTLLQAESRPTYLKTSVA